MAGESEEVCTNQFAPDGRSRCCSKQPDSRFEAQHHDHSLKFATVTLPTQFVLTRNN